MRNLGGSVGISFVTTLLARLSQKHLAMLGAHTVAGNRPSSACAPASPAPGCSTAAAMPDAMHHAGAQIYGMAQIQARLLAYVDVIWVMVVRDHDPHPAAVPDGSAKEASPRPHGPLGMHSHSGRPALAGLARYSSFWHSSPCPAKVK